MQSIPILPVRDLDEAEAFLAPLGAEVRRHDDGYAWVWADDCEVFHLAVHADLDPATNRSALYLHVADVDAVHARLVAGGHDVEAPVEEPWGMREVAVRDPSGNLLRIGAPLGH